MRIVGGTARGRPLKAPRLKTTRPTSDRVREALFDMLAVLPVRWENVLDLYAGSGALGIEALSRGADQADFVESQRAACAVIQENLTRIGFADRARVFCRPVERAWASLDRRYDIILADPPYADPGRESLLNRLAESDLVGGGGFVVLEHSRHHSVGEFHGALRLVKQRRHGDSVLSIFQQGEQP